MIVVLWHNHDVNLNVISWLIYLNYNGWRIFSEWRKERDGECGMNEEELLQRAAEERETIVLRYKKGRQEGAEIDPWEDPAFEIYHVLDRYGFIQ